MLESSSRLDHQGQWAPPFGWQAPPGFGVMRCRLSRQSCAIFARAFIQAVPAQETATQIREINMNLSAIDDHGKPVDWWFMYKVAGKSKSSTGDKVTGTEYVYFDSNMASGGKLSLSPNRVDADGALPNTLAQLYHEEGASTAHLGWYFYNDENPITGRTNGERGHTKGVLAFDLRTNTAFWLVQSTPKFPPKDTYSFPKTGEPNAQTLLCITLQDATVAQAIAKQQFTCQQPNVYLASTIPLDLENEPNDPRLKLMKDQAASGSTPVSAVIPFHSKGGTKFMSMAKNRTWGLDFYNDLVGPACTRTSMSKPGSTTRRPLRSTATRFTPSWI